MTPGRWTHQAADATGPVRLMATGPMRVIDPSQPPQRVKDIDKAKQLLVDNDERGTNLIFRSLKNTARVGKNSVSDQVVEILKRPEAKFEDVAPLVRGASGRVLLETGDLDAGLIWAGQVQGLIHDIPTVAELMQRIMREATEIIRRRLPGMAVGVAG